MDFYTLEPEVAGELGQETEMDRNAHPPIVHKLHFVFVSWLGDDLIECFPCFLASTRLKSRIEDRRLTGCIFEFPMISRDQQFDALYGDREIPEFYWLKVIGKDGQDSDFSTSSTNLLVVSERALEVLRSCVIDHCEIGRI